jgi:catechol 2,3-dioxygenase-like lactoylglutathione lyase family enzyme
MIDHTGIGVTNVDGSGVFYDKALKALGLRRVMQIPENVGTDGIGYGVSFPIFWNHIEPLSRGGEDVLENVCPAHHREVHIGRRSPELLATLRAIRR